jgi:membrane-bound lytic murein transglycosylase F
MTKMRRGVLIIGAFQLLALAGVLAVRSCTPEGNKLQQVQRAGELVVLTRNSPTTYYDGPDGPTGIEYDLAAAFARRLGVKVRIVVPDHYADILPMIARGDGDLAAAGITVTPARAQVVRFAPPYQDIRQQLVYRLGTPRPRTLDDLAGQHLEVVAGSSYAERLGQLQAQHPSLTWIANDTAEAEELLQEVQEELLTYTIADSNVIALSLQFNTDLRVAFDISEPESLAWAFPQDADDSLFREAARFFEEARATGLLAQLIEQYYGAVGRFNPINLAAFTQRVRTDLDQFRPLFEKAEQAYNIDWRLLAAMAYQESYWNPKAASPTGVRGLMMLTSVTAEHLGVTDRENPEQSLLGGARYLRQILDRLPHRIRDPDRTWLALAAYNVGINHLEDARILTQRQGGNPDSWGDVKQHLPLLAKSAWYTQTKNGYARGYEPVQFVNRIRLYYEILKRMDGDAPVDNDVLKLKLPAI